MKQIGMTTYTLKPNVSSLLDDPPPGWPNRIKKQNVQSPVQSLHHTEDSIGRNPENQENLEKEDSRNMIEVYYKPAKRDSDRNIIEGL